MSFMSSKNSLKKKRLSSKIKTVKYNLTKPILLSKKTGENEFGVFVEGNYNCKAKVTVGKVSKIQDIPLVNDLDLIMIDIPMNTSNRDSLVPNFTDNVKKLKDRQRQYINYYHATDISFDYESGTSLCLSVDQKTKEKGYTKANFPSSVSNALLELLIGGH